MSHEVDNKSPRNQGCKALLGVKQYCALLRTNTVNKKEKYKKRPYGKLLLMPCFLQFGAPDPELRPSQI